MKCHSSLIRTLIAGIQAVRRDWCRHDWQRDGEPFRWPGKQWSAAEQRYRCARCGALRQDDIF